MPGSEGLSELFPEGHGGRYAEDPTGLGVLQLRSTRSIHRQDPDR